MRGEIGQQVFRDCAPDDACGDGTYDLTVRVSDGTGDATAGISVMLSTTTMRRRRQTPGRTRRGSKKARP